MWVEFSSNHEREYLRFSNVVIGMMNARIGFFMRTCKVNHFGVVLDASVLLALMVLLTSCYWYYLKYSQLFSNFLLEFLPIVVMLFSCVNFNLCRLSFVACILIDV